MNSLEHKNSLHIVAFDFANKTSKLLTTADMATIVPGEQFLWVDLDHADYLQVKQFTALNLLQVETLQDIIEGEPTTRLSRHDDYLHLAVSACEINPELKLIDHRLDLVLYENFMLTAHHGDQYVIDTVKGEYQADFERFAKTSSFLVFEFWDALIEHYAEIQKQQELQVEQIQHKLVSTVDDEIFQQVSAIGENLLYFRGLLVPTRTVLTELAGRRSHLISEATQSSLKNIVGTLEQVLQDVLVDRDILTQSVNLYMSIISHRTNQAMGKLTVISVIFLPLTFLCGVYGMNFQVFPEIHWKYGYVFFWTLCISIVSVLVYVLRRNRLL